MLFYELLIIVIETKNVFDDFTFSKGQLSSIHSKMTTRSQKRKAVAELASGEFEASNFENNLVENLVAGPSNSPKIQPEELDEIKTSLRKEIMSDLTKIFADNQKDMLKRIASVIKKSSTVQNLENSDSESESILPNTTSTPIRS